MSYKTRRKKRHRRKQERKARQVEGFFKALRKQKEVDKLMGKSSTASSADTSGQADRT